MLPIIAGIISSLISGGLPKVAQAVVDNGVEYVESKLGIKLEPGMNQEKLQQISQEAIKHEEFCITQENANTADARDMNEHIQESANASWLAKNTAYLIDFCIILATIILSAFAFFVGVPPDNKEIIYTALGSLFTLTGTTVNFHRGTSSSSRAKDNVISELQKKV